jgi:hypothetical protein
MNWMASSNTDWTKRPGREIRDGWCAIMIAIVVVIAAAQCAAQTAPVINSLSPNGGPVGTSVTISGTGFGSTQSTSTITFNGTIAAARGRNATSWSNTSIVVAVPSGATSGSVIVKVGTQSSNPVQFTVGTVITSISASSGAPGNTIVVNGLGFGAVQGASTITFNGTPGTPSSWSDSSIMVPVPAGATTGNVVVTSGGSASNGMPFTVAPIISGLSVATAAVGASITVTGKNFGSTQGASTVTFNGTACTPASWSDTSILAPVPLGATSGNVVVTANGMASNGLGFSPGPFISGLSLSSAPAGTAITVSGGNFGATQGASTIKFNATLAVPTSWTNTSISALVPSGAGTGNVVVTSGGLASNGLNFTVTVSLAITGVSPRTGSPGDSVTITGTGFGATQGTSLVQFNGTSASVTSWSNTQIIAVVPSTATSGPITVTVSGATATGGNFTVLPVISALTFPEGPESMGFAIQGRNFGDVRGPSIATLDGQPMLVISWKDTEIKVTVPVGASSGFVVVQTSAGSSQTNPSFQVVPPFLCPF